MFFDDEKRQKQTAKWIIGIITSCILIFLAVRYISAIAYAVSWVIDLIYPLIPGLVLSLILNVPLRFMEKHLFTKKPTPRKEKAKRPLAILLSLILVIGIFTGIAVLVIPELVSAVTVVVTSITNGLEQMATFESNVDYSAIPFGDYLSIIDIDWLQLKIELEGWLKELGNSIMSNTVNALGNVVTSVVDGAVGFVFSIYILANKEKLKRQVARLVRVWLPEKFGNMATHIVSVCSETFHLFIVGQTTEAVILGTLCTIGMLILRIPYAPMIGALVGVMALIPYVGAFISTIVGAFMILTVSPFKALIFVIFLLALQQIEGNLIYPKIVGIKINLPAMWVLAAITIGGNLAGPAGMLLGVPAASAAYSLLREATENRERKKNTSDTVFPKETAEK